MQETLRRRGGKPCSQSMAKFIRDPIIGADRRIRHRLTCFEWTKKSGRAAAVPQRNVWAGAKMNGSWLLTIAKAGKYRFELRRYPKEADFPMSGSYPQTKRELVNFKACRALPIAKARMKIGEIDRTVDVEANDKHASFEVELSAGDIELKTWLLDKAGAVLCGAYYVEVIKL